MDLLLIAEQAAQTYLQASASVSGVQYDTGTDNESMTAPMVICNAYDAYEEHPGTTIGLWHVSLNITVKERASQTATNTSLASTIYSAFLTGSIEQSLMAASGNNFTVFNVWTKPLQRTVENKMWTSTLQTEIACCL